MRALVVGGAGFVGASLVERLLAEDWLVEVVDDLSSGSIDRLADARGGAAHALRITRHDVCDVTTAELVARAAPDRIYFLADGSSRSDPAERVAVAAIGLVRVLEGARLVDPVPKVIVGLASSDLYGHGHGTDPVTEQTDWSAEGASGAGALAVLGALQAYRRGASIEHTVLVLGEVYGPAMPDLSVVGALGSGADSLVVSPGSFDLVHLDDTVDAFVRAATRGDGLVVNIGSGAAVADTEIVAALRDLGSAAAVGGDAIPVESVVLDISRASIHLGWTPFTPLSEGLRTVLAP